MQWEYRMLTSSAETMAQTVMKAATEGDEPPDESLIQQLNELGADGWELVDIATSVSMGSTHSIIVMLKRPRV